MFGKVNLKLVINMLHCIIKVTISALHKLQSFSLCFFYVQI